MKNLKCIIVYFLLNFISAKILNNKVALDSLFNIYKTGITNSHLYKEIANTTWKEYFISEKIKNLKKIFPLHINSDKELDLFVQDHSDQLFWIDNVRGTSKDFTHKRLSNIFIGDFVVANKFENNKTKEYNNMFILATNQNKDKIIQYKKNPYYNPLVTNDTLHNTKKYWEETIFLSITDSSFTELLQITKYTKIKSLDIYKVKKGDYEILLLNLENIHTHSCKLIKIRIKEEKIISIDGIGTELKNINIVGLYDMNNDGLIDILYIDSNNILYIYLNQDPYYFSIELYKLNPTKIDNLPRLFIFDANKDMYPDIITGDTHENTISLLLNPGRNYWKKILDFYDKKNADKSEVYKDVSWQYLPLIDSKEQNINDKIKDFTIIMIDKSKRLSFEIVGIFGSKIYWFIEKDNNNGYSQSIYQHLINSFIKCDIFIEKLNGDDIDNEYDIIIDIDLNKDLYPEFIIYSYKLENMIYIQRKETILTQYGWSQSFWIYLMIGIYTMSTIIGGLEFYRLKNVNEKFSMQISTSLINNEDYKKSQNIEMGQVNDKNNF
jgi:hypothetical protein